MTDRHVHVLIIGGGPGGLSAAIAAATAGAKVLVIDENLQPGGQIYRQLPEAFQALVIRHRRTVDGPDNG